MSLPSMERVPGDDESRIITPGRPPTTEYRKPVDPGPFEPALIFGAIMGVIIGVIVGIAIGASL